MPLLRSAAECALDEVADLCQETADGYRNAGAATQNTELMHLFAELEEARQKAVTRLRAEIRRMGNLPDAPDADREALEHLVTRVKAAVAADEREVLLADCRRLEEKLAAAIADALAEDLPVATFDLLQRLQKEGDWIRVRLWAIR